MLLTLILATCRGGAPKKNQPSSRSFPSAEIPQILEEPQERMDWLVGHFWDRFLDPAVSEVSDSLHLNGITTDEVEKQVGMFTTLLQQAQPSARSRAMEKVFSLSEAYSQAHPASGMLLRLGDLLRKYLYDPSSPVRDEECYLPFITRLCASPLAESSMVPSYEWERNICLLNRPGSPAPDFAFTDLRGQVKTLYGIRSDYTVLIFGNPDCTACRQLMTAFREAPAIAGGIESGRLKVVDIFIDEVTGQNLNTIFIPDVEGFVYKQKELPLDESKIIEREAHKYQLTSDLEVLCAELIVMIDGAPICLHANYLFSEQFFVSYNSIMAAVELAMNHTPYGFGDRVDSYYQALESSETIASYETSQAAMRSEYRQYFAILEKMLQSL